MPRLDAKRAEKLVEDLDDLLDSYTTRVKVWGDHISSVNISLSGEVVAFTSRLGFEASVLQLICERYTEEPVDLSGGEVTERTYNNSRHRAKTFITNLLRSWGYDQRVASLMGGGVREVSAGIIARRVVDDVLEDVARKAFEAGAMGGVPEGDGQDQWRELTRRFEGWWLSCGEG